MLRRLVSSSLHRSLRQAESERCLVALQRRHLSSSTPTWSSSSAPPKDRSKKRRNDRPRKDSWNDKAALKSSSEPKNIKALLSELLQEIRSSEQLSDEPPRQVLARIKRLVQEGAFRKHPHEVSMLMEHLLRIYSRTSYEECKSILNLMTTSKWGKIDVQQAHIEYTVQAAVREDRWKEASDLYLSHIDPDDSGYRPFDVDVANPLGLIAVAKYAQQQDAAVVESVLDAVRQLTMVSPSDQERYVLAAGTAIGLVGEADAFCQYLENSYSAAQLGQPLLASVMHACILSGQYDDALEVFEKHVNGRAAAEEWQWGGGEETLHPLCRDLALRALGGCSSIYSDASARALDLFGQIEEEKMTVSVEAVAGVMKALGKEQRWKDALDLLLDLLQKSYSKGWFVPGETLFISDFLPVEDGQEEIEIFSRMGLVLEPVMRACNAAGHFGLSPFILRMFELSIPPATRSALRRDMDIDLEILGHDLGTVTDSLCPVICISRNTDSLLVTTMAALAETSHASLAPRLYEKVQSLVNVDLESSFILYNFLCEENRACQMRGSFFGEAFKHILRFTSSLQKIVENRIELSSEDSFVLSSVLSSSIEACTSVNQPETGLFLAQWADDMLRKSNDAHSGFFETSEGSERQTIPVTDSLLASLMDAHTSAGRPQEAISLFGTFVRPDSSPSTWLLTYTAGVKALFALDRTGDAMALFEIIAKEKRNPKLYEVATKGLIASGNIKAASDFYGEAFSSGCASEELVLLTIGALASSRTRGKYRLLRNMIEDTAQSAGADTNEWIESKYWRLKKLLGFTDISRLMWWTDPKTSHLDELELAVRVFRARAASGLSPKFDALRLIASAACFPEGHVAPQDRAGLPLLPRNRSSWVDLLQRVYKESEQCALYFDEHFVDSVVRGFFALGREERGIEVLNEALRRGVRVKEAMLNESLEVGTELSVPDFLLDDIRMLTRTGRQ